MPKYTDEQIFNAKCAALKTLPPAAAQEQLNALKARYPAQAAAAPDMTARVERGVARRATQIRTYIPQDIIRIFNELGLEEQRRLSNAISEQYDIDEAELSDDVSSSDEEELELSESSSDDDVSASSSDDESPWLQFV